jgi:hypothetical protein
VIGQRPNDQRQCDYVAGLLVNEKACFAFPAPLRERVVFGQKVEVMLRRPLDRASPFLSLIRGENAHHGFSPPLCCVHF